MKHKKPYDKSVYRSLALVMQFGINMVVPIAMMTALGIWLDQKLGTSFIMILLFFVGAAAGGQNVYRMAKKVYGSAPADSPDRPLGHKKDTPERKGTDSDENNSSVEGRKQNPS